MRVVEITDSKVEKMSSLVEDMLMAGGKLMSCLERLSDEMSGDRYAERDPRYSSEWESDRYSERHHNDRDWDRDMMNERRGYTRRMR